MQISYSALVLKDGDSFVAYSPQLDLSSCGDTPQEARSMLKEAVRLLLEEIERMGTAETVLTELGYTKEKDFWNPPQVVEVSLQEVA